MWKCITRGVRETLERGANFGRNDVRVRQETQRKQQCCSKFTSFTGSASNKWWDVKKEKKDSQAADHNHSAKYRKEKTFYEPKNSFLSAVSCSSALILGWVLTQPYYHWRNWWCDGDRKCLTSCSPILSSLNFTKSRLSFLGLVAFAHPNTPDSNIYLTNGSENSIQYGPLTAEQALDEAVNEVRRVHESAKSISDNLKGVEYMSKRRHREGISLFRRASMNYAPAAFNLAQCYELGLGTKQDFSCAAEWYQKAANMGHAGAIYNLAVFYAHGWGGLPADPKKARELLVKAADLGQPDAKAALGRSDQPPPTGYQPVIEQNEMWESSCSGMNDDSDSADEFSNNAEALYSMAVSFENSSQDFADPHLIMDLYKFASELGHSAAKARFQTLQAYDSIGLLTDFLWGSTKTQAEISDLENVLFG